MTPRNRELTLIIIITVFMLTGLFLVNAALTGSVMMKTATLGMAAVFLFIFLMANVATRFLSPESSPYFLPLSMLLSGIGLITIYRLDPAMAANQLIWLAIGLSFLVAVLLFFENYKKVRHYKYLIGMAGLLLLVLPLLPKIGTEVNGSRLWLNLGLFRFQPSEFAKVLLVIFFAVYLEQKKEVLNVFTFAKAQEAKVNIKNLGPLIVMWVISLFIMVLAKDLGSSLLFFALFVVMLYLGTGRLSYTLAGSVLFLMGASACYFLFTHVQLRFNVWLNPWADVKGAGYQIIQSLFAIANGQMTGTGLGLGLPNLIPAVKTDFIFSAISEESGFLGGAAVILIFLVFIYAGLKTALKSNDELGKMIAAGLTFIFGFQAFIILGGVTKLLPLTGVTLPFVSYGGSSVVANFMIVGFLLTVSNKENTLE